MKKALNKIRKDQNGMAVLIIILVLTSAMLAIALTLGIGSITQNQISLYQQKEEEVIIGADSCSEEAIMRLSINNTYSGGSLTIGDVSCTIAISGSMPDMIVDVVATKQAYTKTLQVEVNLNSPVSVTSWNEI